jgi:glycosyltransferase involved in cell wall biosynthesis
VVGELTHSITGREKDARVARREREAIQKKAQKAENDLAAARAELKKMKATASWRLTKPLRTVRTSMKEFSPPGGYSLATRRVRKVLREGGLLGATKRAIELLTGKAKLGSVPVPTVVRAAASLPPVKRPFPVDRFDFTEWLRLYDTLTAEDRAGLAARARAFAKKPLISVVMPTYNTNVRWLREAIESVQQQIYPHWELCIVDDASTRAEVRSLLEGFADSDPRIRVHFREQNGHISLATNDGIALAKGEWIALLDHDDILRDHALFWVAQAINDKPNARLIYSDEDKLLDSGQRVNPYFKPDWNPDLFLSHNMICHLGVYQTSLVREIGGCRAGFEGAQDYDLALRYIERLSADQIHHVPRVLYSWRVHAASTASDGEAKPYAVLAGQRALDEHFARKGIRASTEIEPSVSYRTRYELPAQRPLVTIIIPTRNAVDLVRQCIESIVKRTTYENYEILLIDNGSDDPAATQYFNELARDKVIRLLRDDRAFNYSALNNAAVQQAQGEFVCLLNNDIEVISPDWLSEMVSIGIQKGVGAVGARLWYPNQLLQHGGVILGIGGVAGHSHKGHPKGNRGYFGRAALIQSFSAVTGACLLIRKSIFEQVGGLNEVDLKIAFNDVDFCLRVGQAGYRNVWTPYAELYHHESATRGFEDSPQKIERFEREERYMKVRWGPKLATDPAYNPNLSLGHEDFSWAWPTRVDQS